MGIDFNNIDWQAFILRMAVLIIAITIHEFAHAITADKLGDPTPRTQGRISLLPPDHLDPIGTVMMFLSSLTGFGIGWGKPVMTNPNNFKSPRRDSAIVAVAGPISNILQAIVFALIVRATGGVDTGTPMGIFLLAGVTVNVSLAFFNMIPLGPLDGHWVIQAVLPYDQAKTYEHWNRAYGGMIFLLLVLAAPGMLSRLIGPAVVYVARLLLV